MHLAPKTTSSEPPRAPTHGFRLMVEREPWLRMFLRNVADVFRADPPAVWVSARPATYWPDALVYRPVAWAAMGQSLLCHLLVAASVYALTLFWLNQPHVIVEEPFKTATLHYELTEYLPEVTPRHKMPITPMRPHPQTADPEYSPQQIISIDPEHISNKQTIVQPNPNILHEDVRLPNLVISTPFPGAPMAMNHPLQVLPVNVPQVVPPAPQATERNLAARAMPMNGPIVVPPAQDTAARTLDGLQIPVQSPEVVRPAMEIAAQHALAQALSLSAPEVVPPAQGTAQRDFSRLGLPAQQPDAAQPAQPITSGTGQTQAREIGQLLALNAHPIAPTGSVVVPEGNRGGEFAAGPEGHPGATARPEIKQGDTNSAAHAPGEGAGPANIYVSPPPPPTKTVAGATAGKSAVPTSPTARTVPVDRTDKRPADSIDEKIFGTRKHYSMRLNMPNLNSSMGSWSIRFAELNPTSHSETDISAPEAVRKVDPAYPQDLMHGKVEGVVVLYAIIHSDGSVGEVRILEGFEARLDENARTALQQWHFRPGTRDGTPVDIEAVVRVPFRVPRNAF